ncbi:MAG: hypothetical protein M3Y81_09985 [Chloroflexota bacterium]|nr:hypothetical protein [Chloroflexota bacterium]
MPTVETLFIDASTGEVFERVDMPADRLPASFVPATTMHIDGEDWRVIKAEPMTAEEFVRTGRLVLMLQKMKIVKVPVRDILFTLPTLCNEIPPLVSGSTKYRKNILELHEDDWRQIECLSSSYRSVIDAEVANVMRVYREASVDNGLFLGFTDLGMSF